MAEHNFQTLTRRLSRAGFKSEFLRTALLPDWWDEACVHDPSVMPDLDVRVARFLSLPLATVRDGRTTLAPALEPGAQLRRVRNVDRDRLAPAIHTAMQIGSAVNRNLRGALGPAAPPPTNGRQWREAIRRDQSTVALEDILRDLWGRGIPVVPIDLLPSPSFQGAAFVLDERPIIVLGHKLDEPGRVAFLAAHEAGHIAAGDCQPEHPVIDEEDEVNDISEMEQRADRFATDVLVGEQAMPDLAATHFKELAKKAIALEKTRGIDASMIIFSWAAKTGEYGQASLAAKALYRASGQACRLRPAMGRPGRAGIRSGAGLHNAGYQPQIVGRVPGGKDA